MQESTISKKCVTYSKNLLYYLDGSLYPKLLNCIVYLTVLARVGSANSWNRSTSCYNQLITVTLVIGGLWLGEDEAVHV